jgi:hypothetical protein
MSAPELPEPSRSGPRFSWKEVEQQVAAGLILAAVAGVGYIAWTVPRQLDQIYQQQVSLIEQARGLESEVSKHGEALQGLDRRVTRLEARP